MSILYNSFFIASTLVVQLMLLQTALLWRVVKRVDFMVTILEKNLHYMAAATVALVAWLLTFAIVGHILIGPQGEFI
jgi:hypothetical protein